MLLLPVWQDKNLYYYYVCVHCLESCLRNALYCVRWDVYKYPTHSHRMWVR